MYGEETLYFFPDGVDHNTNDLYKLIPCELFKTPGLDIDREWYKVRILKPCTYRNQKFNRYERVTIRKEDFHPDFSPLAIFDCYFKGISYLVDESGSTVKCRAYKGSFGYFQTILLLEPAKLFKKKWPAETELQDVELYRFLSISN